MNSKFDFNTALTFDDVLLVPGKSEILPKDVILTATLTKGSARCKSIKLNRPIISAAMDTVTETAMAIAQAQEGGIGFIHKNMSVDQQAKQVSLVKKFESGVVKDPVTVKHNMTIAEVVNQVKKHNFSSMPVLENGQLIGLVTNRDLRFVSNTKQLVTEVMTPLNKLITILEGSSVEMAAELMHTHRIEKLLVVNDAGSLLGIMTARDIINSQKKPLATKDERGRLMVGAAIGVCDESKLRADALVAADCDVIVIDTAHGHSLGVINQVKWFKSKYPQVPVIAGNIVTGAAAIELVDAGVDAVKVGVGPGSICTTRVVSGAGMPQVTAIMGVAQALQSSGVPVIADGGVRYSGDITKAIACGASTVMIGSLFAGCEESPGAVELYQGRSYKVYRGMGSIDAMSQQYGSSDRYFQNANTVDKLVPEGVEGRVAYKGLVQKVIHQLIGGLRSGMGYVGCSNLELLQQYTNIIRVSGSGVKEGHVHDVTITKETPNYSID